MKTLSAINAINALAKLKKEEAARSVRLGDYNSPDSYAHDAQHVDDSVEDVENIKAFAAQALAKIRGQNV